MDRSGLPLFGTVLILAGGQSRRMGFDKQVIAFGQMTLVERIIDQLRPLFQDVVIVTNRPELYTSLTEHDVSIRVTADVYPGKGPMGGIHAGLGTARSRQVYVTGCDMPHQSVPLIRYMMQAAREGPGGEAAGVMIRRDDGRLEPLNAFYHIRLVNAMEASLIRDQNSLQRFCSRQPFIWLSEQVVSGCEGDRPLFRSLNRPEDLQAWREREMDGMEEMVKPVEILRVSPGDETETTDCVIREIRLIIRSKDRVWDHLYCLPDRLEDLITGWLRTNGKIGSIDAIDAIAIRPDDDNTVTAEFSLNRSAHAEKVDSPPSRSQPVPGADGVARLIRLLETNARLFRITGGTHNMALVRGKDQTLMDHCEDVSRHQCLNKLIGRAIREARDLRGEWLVTSSRLTASIIEMMVISGIGMAISKAALTSHALELAAEHGIPLIGFARGARYNRYEP